MGQITDGFVFESFYLKDGLGSVMAIIDEKANIVQSYEYSAFGECLSGKDAVNAFRFVGGFGGQTDDDTGLVYFWNRWYDPQAGRWISEDPIRWDSGDGNLFGYVRNNPALLRDSHGLFTYNSDNIEVTGPLDIGLAEMVECLEKESDISLVVTGGTEKVGHGSSIPNSHTRGEAVDFSFKKNPGLKGDDNGLSFRCAAKKCGFKHLIEEPHPPQYHFADRVPSNPSNEFKEILPTDCECQGCKKKK